MNKWILALLVICATRAAHAGEVPSLSIVNIKAETVNPWVIGWDNRRSAIRGLVISELSQRYDCHVQTRWQGLDVVQEQALTELAYIDRLRVPVNEVQTADYVLAAHFSETQQGSAVTGQVVCVTMRLPQGAKPKTDGMSARNVFQIGESMAQAAAPLVPLQPRVNGTSGHQAIGKNAVLVACSLANYANVSRQDEEAALARAEVALQEKGFTSLVDRRRLDAVLKEHKMEAQGVDASGAVNPRLLAGLVHAEFLVMGQIAPWEKGRRLDLFLVHAGSGAILAARTGYFDKPAELADVAARCASELVDIPVALPTEKPGSLEARKREARLFLPNEGNPAEIKYGGDLASVVNAVEDSYTLVHDDEDFVYQIMDRLERDVRGGGFYMAHLDPNLWPFMSRAARLINTGLGALQDSSKWPNLLLMRAEALSYGGRPAEGLPLAKRYLAEHPGEELVRVGYVCAYSEHRLGHPEQALAYLDRAKLRDSGNWLAARILAEIEQQRAERVIKAAKAVGPQAEYEKYRDLFMTPTARPSFDDLSRYLDLMRKTKGPKVALVSDDLAFKASVIWRNAAPWPDLTTLCLILHKALCEADSGNTVVAAQLCKNIMASIDSPNQAFYYKPMDWMYKEASNRLAKIEAENGPVKDLWKTARETRLYKAGGYRIYVVPIGDEIKTTMDNVRMFLGEYYGDMIKFLPPLPVPQEAAPKGDGNQYDRKVLFTYGLKNVAVPDDALLLIFITRLNIGEPLWSPSFSAGDFESPQREIYNPFLISYSKDWCNDEPKAAREGAKRFALKFPRILHLSYGVLEKRDKFHRGYVRCPNYPCLFCDNLYDILGGASWVRFQMCPACQADYAKADFGKIHNDLMAYLNKAGVKIVKAGAVAESEVSRQGR